MTPAKSRWAQAGTVVADLCQELSTSSEPRSLAAVPGMADISDQSCRWHRGDRPLCFADNYVPPALLSRHSAPRASTVGLVRVTANPTEEWISALQRVNLAADHCPCFDAIGTVALPNISRVLTRLSYSEI
jgi:hypothetical protein